MFIKVENERIVNCSTYRIDEDFIEVNYDYNEFVSKPQNYYLYDGRNIIKNPNYEKEEEEKEKERIAHLYLTGADVERAIYKDKHIDFEDIIKILEKDYADKIDVKQVKIELKANNFFRGNPYVSQIGLILGYSEQDLDYLFEHKELPNS